jgi:hypothetical protein
MEIMETARNLAQIMKQLPPEAKNEIEDFARFLLEKRAKKKPPKQKRFGFHRLSGVALKARLNSHPLFKTEDDIYEMTQWGEVDSEKQRKNLRKLSGIFASEGPNDGSENVDSYVYD